MSGWHRSGREEGRVNVLRFARRIPHDDTLMRCGRRSSKEDATRRHGRPDVRRRWMMAAGRMLHADDADRTSGDSVLIGWRPWRRRRLRGSEGVLNETHRNRSGSAR